MSQEVLVIQHFRHCSEQKLARQGEVKEGVFFRIRRI